MDLKKIISRQYSYGLQAAIWVGFIMAGFLSFSVFFTAWAALRYALVNVLLLAMLFYTHTFLVNRFLEKKKILWFLLLGGCAFATIVILRVVANNNMMQNTDAEGRHFFENPKMRVSALVMVTSIIVVLIAVAYQLLFNRFKNEQKNLALINEQQAAQLRFLKAQINPHFLFNALNNVYSLTVVKSDDAPKMLLKLSDLLRYVIYESQKDKVELSREIQHIEKFIELFKMRSEDPLSISLQTQGNLSGVLIEPMILIPLVENCFKHCDFDQNPMAFTKIHIETCPINASSHSFYIRFFSQNTFDKTDQQKDGIGGVGLENISRRLALRYPNAFELTFGAAENLFTVELTVFFKTITLSNSI